MERLTDAGLPARRDERRQDRAEPVDPGTQGKEPAVRGKSPDEVLGEGADRRPTQQPASTAKDDPSPLAKREDDEADTGKGKEKAVKFAIRGEGEFTAEQLAKRPDLLDKVIRSANQLPSQVQKTHELLEQFAAAKLKEEAAAAAPATPEQQVQERQQNIARHQQATLQVVNAYKQLAAEESAFWQANNLLEQDMAEGFPLTVSALFAVILHQSDRLTVTENALTQCKEWIRAQVDQRNALAFASQNQTQLQSCIDKVAEKGGKLFEALRDKDVQQEFETWLKNDIDPKMGAVTPENIERLWIAHNADKLIEFANLDNKQVTQPTRRTAKSDGPPSTRPGSPEPIPENKSLLDRMTDRMLQPQE